MPKIYASLDNRQVDHQDSVMEMEGTIVNHLISILIVPGSNLSYVTPQTVEKCKLQQVKHIKSWPVQLATGTKRKVTEVLHLANSSWMGCPPKRPLTYLL